MTYYDPARRVLFVEDSTGGVYVNTSKNYPLRVGDLVDIVGTSDHDFQGDVAVDPAIRVIGHGVLPTPVRLHSDSGSDVLIDKWDSHRVTARVIVRTALGNPNRPGRLDLEMLLNGMVVQGSVLDAGSLDPSTLVDSEVEITATLGAVTNAKEQYISLMLYCNQASDLQVLHRPTTAARLLPLTTVNLLLERQSLIDLSRRIQVRGAVTYFQPGRTIVIQQDGHSVTGYTWQRGNVPLGSVVDLSGFPSQGDYGPVLKQAMFSPTGLTEAVPPKPVTYDSALKGTYDDELVSMRGQLVSQNHGEKSDTLTLFVERHLITVMLVQPVDGRWLPMLRAGSEVEVTGICRVSLTTTPDRPHNTPMFFRIDMRSADDIKVLRLPSWWTMDHVLRLLAIVCFLSVVLALWAFALRRRVSQQSEELRDSMRLEQERSRMLQAISSDSPLRDLLDDLCATCESLVHDVQCGYEVTADEHLSTAHLLTGTVFEQEQKLVLYESRMEDGHGRLLGHFRVGALNPRALSTQESEIFDVFAGLATLAVDQRRMYQDLNYTSTHDQLTGLPNRRLADSCLEDALRLHARSNAMVAVVYIDVDHFKQVNDQYGHRVGDQYLQLIATRMRGAVRSSDTLARIGGDEFLLVASGLCELDEIERYRHRLLACFAEPFLLEGHTIVGSASFGIAIAPEHGTLAEDLKRKADVDMYAFKHHHRTHSDLRAVAEKPEPYSVEDLETAMNDDRFHLFYQPQFCPDGTLCGLEALLRLTDPVRGIVAPDAFIGVVERHDLIHSLGSWVLREALADAARWNLPAMKVRMMVNISIRQAEHPEFASSALQIIAESGIAPAFVELEITERMLMHDMPEASKQLSYLRESGVNIAIDDFGVEHSCLSVLHRLPFDTLKLDRTFIRAMHEDKQAIHIVGAIVSMANSLGKRVVAEGVETIEHVRALAAFRNVDLQGYYFSRPRPAGEIAHALKTWNNTAPARELHTSRVDTIAADPELASPRLLELTNWSGNLARLSS